MDVVLYNDCIHNQGEVLHICPMSEHMTSIRPGEFRCQYVTPVLLAGCAHARNLPHRAWVMRGAARSVGGCACNWPPETAIVSGGPLVRRGHDIRHLLSSRLARSSLRRLNPDAAGR